MGKLFYYREYEGADDARIRCARGEELLRMTGDRYYKNVVNYLPLREEVYPFFLEYAGEEYAAPEKAIVNTVDSKTTYLHFAFGGRGWFNGQEVKAGDAFTAWMGDFRTILVDPDDPLRFYWLGVGGTDHMEMLERFGFARNDRVFSCGYLGDVRRILYEILYAPFSGVNETAYLTGKLLLMLAYQSPTPEAPVGVEEEQYVASAKRMMADSRYLMPVENVAKKLGISRQHLSLLFRRQEGCSIRAYVLEHRRDLAQGYLQNGYTPKEVGELLGYNDYSAFFSFFKDKVGQTPAEYAERCNAGKKEQKERP